MPRLIVLGAVAVFSSIAVSTGIAAAPPELAPAVSTFTSNPKDKGFGRDPFYPASARFAPPEEKPKVVVVAQDPVTPVVPKVVEPVKPVEVAEVNPQLTLNGVIGRYSAFINNVSLSVGEELPVKTPEGTFKVKLEKVNSSTSVTVVIQIGEGKTKTKEITARTK